MSEHPVQFPAVDEEGLVERPNTGNGGTLTAKLKRTAETGKAVLVRRRSTNNYYPQLRNAGYRVHSTLRGAPEGWRYVWAEKI